MDMSELDLWRGYRQDADGLTWRVATPDDIPALEHLWAVKERVLQRKIDRPDFFKPPCLITLVAEDEHGRILDALYAEAHIDITKIGCSLKGFESTPKVAGHLAMWLKSRGFRLASIIVPKVLSARMAGTLKEMGFSSTENRSIYWRKWLG